MEWPKRARTADWENGVLGILLLFVTDYLKQKKICIREIVARQDAWCQVLIIAFSSVFSVRIPKYFWKPLEIGAMYLAVNCSLALVR